MRFPMKWYEDQDGVDPLAAYLIAVRRFRLVTLGCRTDEWQEDGPGSASEIAASRPGSEDGLGCGDGFQAAGSRLDVGI